MNNETGSPQKQLTWEILDTNEGQLHRLRVPGGWLIKVFEAVSHHLPDRGLDSGYDFRVALTFMPDQLHSWNPAAANAA